MNISSINKERDIMNCAVDIYLLYKHLLMLLIILVRSTYKDTKQSLMEKLTLVAPH